jgi:predicted nucleotidyltransferase
LIFLVNVVRQFKGPTGNSIVSQHLMQNALPLSIQRILTRARAELHLTAIVLFGSRARGTATPTYDFDIAIQGVEDDVL